MNEIEAFAILTSIPHLGPIKIRLLLQNYGTAVEALKMPASDIAKLAGFSQIAAHWNFWKSDFAWKKDLALAAQHNATLIPFTDPLFPKALLTLPDHPALLYVRGTLKPQDQRSIAIVGTRRASIYGNEMAETIAKELAANGFTVISGLARGIDTAAHRGALQTGRTMAVIGSGLADIYPPENHHLADSMTTQGALISEFSMNTPPNRQNFPQRNRIVSGMSMGTLLIEAPVKSGAMITMEKSFQYKRKLFALPGRADQENFRGNHLLIKSGKAQLVENAADIMAHFQDLFPLVNLKPSPRQGPMLDSEEQALLNEMPNEEISIELISRASKFPIQQINRVLMSLVMKKAVKEFPGKIYKKIS